MKNPVLFFIVMMVVIMFSASGLLRGQAVSVIYYPAASSLTDTVLVSEGKITSTGGVDTLFVTCICNGGGGSDTSAVVMKTATGLVSLVNSGLAPNTSYACHLLVRDSADVVRATSGPQTFHTRYSPRVPDIVLVIQSVSLYTGAMVDITANIGGSNCLVVVEEATSPYPVITGPFFVPGNGILDTAFFVPIPIPGTTRNIQISICAVDSTWGCDLSAPLVVVSDSLDGCMIQSAWVDSITPTQARASVVVAEGGAGSCIVVSKLRPTIPPNSSWTTIGSLTAQNGDTVSVSVTTSQGTGYQVQFTVSDTMSAIDTVLSFTTPVYGPPIISNVGMVSGQNPNSIVLSGVSAQVDAPGSATLMGVVFSQDPQYQHVDTVKTVVFNGDTTLTAVIGPIFGGVPYTVRWILTDAVGQDTVTELVGVSTVFPSAVGVQIVNTTVGATDVSVHVRVLLNGNGTVRINSLSIYQLASGGFNHISSIYPNDVTVFRDTTFGPYVLQGLDPQQTYMVEAVVEAMDGIRVGETSVASWTFTTSTVGVIRPTTEVWSVDAKRIEVYTLSGTHVASTDLRPGQTIAEAISQLQLSQGLYPIRVYPRKAGEMPMFLKYPIR